MNTTKVSFKTRSVNGFNIFYREAGDPGKILLLHGFPTSSHMFRHLISNLAADYYVIAPDLPGYGLSNMPDRKSFSYTFDHLAELIGDFVDQIGLKKFSIYIFDYGAPVGLRVALRFPDRISAIITQNGNAYVEGFSTPWEPWQNYWKNPTPENRQACRDALSPEVVRDIQYRHGTNVELVSPDGYMLALPTLPGLVRMKTSSTSFWTTEAMLHSIQTFRNSSGNTSRRPWQSGARTIRSFSHRVQRPTSVTTRKPKWCSTRRGTSLWKHMPPKLARNTRFLKANL